MKKQTKTKATRFVTKYALTKGILKVSGELHNDPAYFYYRPDPAYHSRNQIEPSHHFASLNEALVHAEKLRQKRIASLKKQLKKLKEFQFKLIEL